MCACLPKAQQQQQPQRANEGIRVPWNAPAWLGMAIQKRFAPVEWFQFAVRRFFRSRVSHSRPIRIPFSYILVRSRSTAFIT